MAEPAELLLVRDHYQQAFHCLSRGLKAEEAGQMSEALELYRKGRQHLNRGLEVPTRGEKYRGTHWDTARKLQQKMRDTQWTVITHLSELEDSATTTRSQRDRLLKDLPNLYPDQSSPQLLHPAVSSTIPTRSVPVRPPRLAAAAPQTQKPPVEAPVVTPEERPPAYSVEPKPGHRSLTPGFHRQQSAAEGQGTELLYIPSGVQMFFVAPNEQVSSLSYPGYLRIITLDDQQGDPTARTPSSYLQVCDWLYPLTTDTPVLLANSGIFMFPDTVAGTQRSYVGIVLSSELPAGVRQEFQKLLSQLADLRVQSPGGRRGSKVINLSDKVPLGPQGTTSAPTATPPPAAAASEEKPRPAWSEKMSNSILSGATKLSAGLVRGSEATGRAISRGAAKMRDRMTPEETPTEVSPHVHRGLNATRQATGGVLRVSQFLVNGVSTVACHVADKLTPHVKKQGAKVVPESMKTSNDGKPTTMDGVKHVAASSVKGFSQVWSGLETGAKHVGKSVSTETVATVTYKYGEDAGKATDTAMQSVVNVGVAAHTFEHLGIKIFLKTSGKLSTKAAGAENKAEEAAAADKETQKQG